MSGYKIVSKTEVYGHKHRSVVLEFDSYQVRNRIEYATFKFLEPREGRLATATVWVPKTLEPNIDYVMAKAFEVIAREGFQNERK